MIILILKTSEYQLNILALFSVTLLASIRFIVNMYVQKEHAKEMTIFNFKFLIGSTFNICS
jgi:hypothetical protein